MNIKTCGRCGAVYEEYELPNHIIILIPKEPIKDNEVINLCPQCRSEFEIWLGGEDFGLQRNSQNCSRMQETAVE